MTEETAPQFPPWVLNWLDAHFGGRDLWSWNSDSETWQASGSDLKVTVEELTPLYEAAHAHVFILTGGYVESSTTGSLILRHDLGFHYVEDAMASLGKVFKENQQKNWDEAFRYRGHKKCPHCDEFLMKPALVESEDVAEAVYEYIISNSDGSAHDIWERLQEEGWDIGAADIPPEDFARAVVVYESANSIIADVAFGGRTVVERGAIGWEHVFDWAAHMKLPSGVELYRPTPTEKS